MSVQALTWVLDHSESELSDRLVLLSIANHAHPDGTASYAAIPTLAAEARVGESTVRGAIDRLIAMGELTETGSGPKGTRCFAMPLEDRKTPPPRVRKARPWMGSSTSPAPASKRGGPAPPNAPASNPGQQPSDAATSRPRDAAYVEQLLAELAEQHGFTALSANQVDAVLLRYPSKDARQVVEQIAAKHAHDPIGNPMALLAAFLGRAPDATRRRKSGDEQRERRRRRANALQDLVSTRYPPEPGDADYIDADADAVETAAVS